MKLKNFCTAKETINKMKRDPVKWEKIFANHISVTELIPKVYKQLTQLSRKNQIKITNNSIKNDPRN